jgi:hypothetical protein
MRNNPSNGGNTGNISITDSVSTYYIKGKVDGIAFKYYTGVAVTCKKSGQDVMSMVLSAFSERTSKTSSMSLVIGAGNAVIQKGYYSELDIKNLATAGWSASATEAYTSSRSKDNPFTLTVTSMEEHVIAGTFRGEVFLTDANAKVDNSKKKLVTDGEFYIKYKD